MLPNKLGERLIRRPRTRPQFNVELMLVLLPVVKNPLGGCHQINEGVAQADSNSKNPQEPWSS